jgi:hypothetical protein
MVSAPGIAMAAQVIREIEREEKALFGDPRSEREEGLAMADGGPVSADHGRTDPIPLPFGQRPVLASHAKNKNPSW